MRAGAASVAFERPPPASGTRTMPTGSPTLPAPKPVTEDAEILPRPASSFREALASLPGDGGRQAPVLSAPLLVEPPVPLAAASDVTAPSGALRAADPAAPSAAAERAVVAGGVTAQPEGSATTDVQGQPALPASPAPPSAPPPTLAPPPPVQAGSAPALAMAVPPAPPVIAPPAPSAGAPLVPPGVAPIAQPVVAPPAPHVAGLSAPPVAPVTMADLQRAVSAAVREERNGQASQSNSPRVAQTPAAPPPTAPPALAAPRPPANAPPHVPVTAQYPSLLPVDPFPPSAGAAYPFSALLGPQRPVAVPEVTLGQIWRLSEALRVVHLVQVYGHAALSQGDSLVGGPRDDCFAAADRLAELLAPVLAAPAPGGLAGVGPLGSAVRGLRRLLHAGTGSGAIAAGTVLVRELHRTLSGLLAVFDADQV
ncbi:unnamed protein product [Closterium sp. Naga37s-1]|nr:unnamed protein product [Closterium sp. Naga37s-1]